MFCLQKKKKISRTLNINPVAATQSLLYHPYQYQAPQQQPPLQSNTNGNLMYPTSNINIVQPSTGNGAVPHTNGLMTGYPTNTNIAANLPIHPDVKLKKLAFFDVMATLLKPSTLLPTSNNQRSQEGTYYFHLTPQQATDIASNR